MKLSYDSKMTSERGHPPSLTNAKDHPPSSPISLKTRLKKFVTQTNVWLFLCILCVLLIFCPDIYIFGDIDILPYGDYDDYVDIKHSLVLPYPMKPEALEDFDARCEGKRVFMYELPHQFNTGVSERCGRGLIPWMDLCRRFFNSGLGPELWDEGGPFAGWYHTDPYMLEVIFHARMRTYPCRTYDPSKADAFFIPWYGGLDALSWLYNKKRILPRRGRFGEDVLEWLELYGGKSWRKYGGRDHFLVLGRTAWDFNLNDDVIDRWGTGFFALPYSKNVTSLLLERRTRWIENEHAIPYPTAFHPSSPEELAKWIHIAKNAKREFLMSYVGGPRPKIDDSIRGLIGSQCRKAGRTTCLFVDCSKEACSYTPIPITKTLIRANFCIQPKGDTATRRSAFDCMIAGSIPVFFHEDTSYTQYGWHLPEDHANYSVYIPEADIRKGVSVKKVLMSYSPQRIRQMRRNVVKLIPGLVYNNYANPPDSITKDAFELSVQGVIDRAAAYKRAHPTL